MENRSVKERKNLIDKQATKISVREQCKLLEVNRSSLYNAPHKENEEDLKIMEFMDKIYMKNPTYGVLRMQDELLDYGKKVNHKRVRRLMRKMGLEAIYPKPHLSRLGKAKYRYPYLLRGLKINNPNKVWAVDITYIPMKNGFMYLTVMIDLYSRYIVGWHLSNTLEKENQTLLLKDCILKHGKPEVLNSDQGSQYTNQHWAETLQEQGIQISMDGKGRAIDNIFIERFFRTIKQDYVYLNPENNGLELHQGIKKYIHTYNHRRHQGIGRIKPVDKYKKIA